MNSHLIPNPEKSNYKILLKLEKKNWFLAILGQLCPFFG